jgi:hypothetical protein
VEPNGSSSSSNVLGARACGRLASGTEQDWFTFSLAVRGPYDLRLTLSSDARVAVCQRVAGVYYAVSQSSYTRVAKTSSGAGKYLVRVKSPTGCLQCSRGNARARRRERPKPRIRAGIHDAAWTYPRSRFSGCSRKNCDSNQRRR